MDRFVRLPEGCIAEILSLTSPTDAIRSSAVSKGFKSAVDSDTIWERFLPSDIQDIISTSKSPEIYNNYSKKELYFALCDSHLLLDGGRMAIHSFLSLYIFVFRLFLGINDFRAFLLIRGVERNLTLLVQGNSQFVGEILNGTGIGFLTLIPDSQRWLSLWLFVGWILEAG